MFQISNVYALVYLYLRTPSDICPRTFFANIRLKYYYRTPMFPLIGTMDEPLAHVCIHILLPKYRSLLTSEINLKLI